MSTHSRPQLTPGGLKVESSRFCAQDANTWSDKAYTGLEALAILRFHNCTHAHRTCDCLRHGKLCSLSCPHAICQAMRNPRLCVCVCICIPAHPNMLIRMGTVVASFTRLADHISQLRSGNDKLSRPGVIGFPKVSNVSGLEGTSAWDHMHCNGTAGSCDSGLHQPCSFASPDAVITPDKCPDTTKYNNTGTVLIKWGLSNSNTQSINTPNMQAGYGSQDYTSYLSIAHQARQGMNAQPGAFVLSQPGSAQVVSTARILRWQGTGHIIFDEPPSHVSRGGPVADPLDCRCPAGRRSTLPTLDIKHIQVFCEQANPTFISAHQLGNHSVLRVMTIHTSTLGTGLEETSADLVRPPGTRNMSYM